MTQTPAPPPLEEPTTRRQRGRYPSQFQRGRRVPRPGSAPHHRRRLARARRERADPWQLRCARNASSVVRARVRTLLATLGVRQSAYTVATCDDNAAGEACFATLEARELAANQRFGGLTQGEACHRRPDLRTTTWYASTRRLATCHQSSTRFATLGTPWQPRHSDRQQMGGRPATPSSQEEASPRNPVQFSVPLEQRRAEDTAPSVCVRPAASCEPTTTSAVEQEDSCDSEGRIEPVPQPRACPGLTGVRRGDRWGRGWAGGRGWGHRRRHQHGRRSA